MARVPMRIERPPPQWPLPKRRPPAPPVWQRFAYVRSAPDDDREDLWLAEMATASLAGKRAQARDVVRLRSVDGKASFIPESFVWLSLSPNGRYLASLSVQEGPATDPFLDYNLAIHRVADGTQRLFLNEHRLGGLGKADISLAQFAAYVEIVREDILSSGGTAEEADAWAAAADFRLEVDHVQWEPGLSWLAGGAVAIDFYLPVTEMETGTWLGDALFTTVYAGLDDSGPVQRLSITGAEVPSGVPPAGPA